MSQESIRTTFSAKHGGLAAALCFMAFFLHSLTRWAVNVCIYPTVADYFAEARDIATAFTVVCYLSLYLIARWKPSWLDRRLLASIGGGCAVAACALLVVSLPISNPLGTVLGLMLRAVAQSVLVVFLGLALCSLADKRLVTVALVGGTALANCFVSLLPPVNAVSGSVVMAAILITSLTCCYVLVGDFLRVLSAHSAPADLELLNPNSFIPWKSGLYGCTLLFGIVFGFALAFGQVGNAPTYSLVSPAVLVLAFLGTLLAGVHDKEDVLFNLAALLVVAGLACMPLGMTFQIALGNALLDTSTACFTVLIWTVVVAVSRRSIFAVLPTLCIFNALQTLGVEVGAVAGHGLDTLAAIQPSTTIAIVMAALVGFVSFLWLAFRRFSFTETTSRLAQLTTDEDIRGQSVLADQSIDEACDKIAADAGLTNRETEIFALLARGRNGAYIQEKYVISRNTTKTHIRRIYAKLDVHSRQEIIDLVENSR